VTTFKYKAFISYSHADATFAEWLLKSLESYRVPKSLVGTKTENGVIPDRLSPIFRDREELPASGAMTKKLIDALRVSKFLIVIGSPNAAKSKLVNREIMEFKRIHGESRILCMIIEGVPFSGDPETECFPEALAHSFHTDGVKAGLSSEGLAADLRPHADGKSMALMKIIAGILGVGLNDIVQRQERRRQTRVANLAAFTSLGLCVMGGLTFEAISAREEAERARHLAETKTEESTQRLAENEDLTHFLMTNIYEELLTAGSLETLEDITNQILAYYQKRDINKLTERQISSLTDAWLKFGQMLDRRGDSKRAEEVFEETLKISREFYTRSPESSRALFRLSNNLFFTGYLAERQGRTNKALKDYQERLDLLKSAIHRQPPNVGSDWKPRWMDNPETFWREKIAAAEMMVAQLFTSSLRNPKAALEYAQSSVSIRKNIADTNNQDEEACIELGSSYQVLGSIYLRVGQLNEALGAYNKRFSIFERLHREKPYNYRVLRQLLLSKANIARIRTLKGKTETAQRIYREITEGFDVLTKKDPQNTLWLADSARIYFYLAESSFALGDTATFKAAAQQGEMQAKEAIARDKSRPARRITSYSFLLLEAKSLKKEGRTDLAYEKIQTLLSNIKREETTFQNMAGSLDIQTAALLLQGELLTSQKKLSAAQHCWRQIIERHISLLGVASIPAKHTLGLAYSRLGERDKARAVLEALEQAGYNEKNIS
jgi:tetratricopeptide (TPR) repeat protein